MFVHVTEQGGEDEQVMGLDLTKIYWIVYNCAVKLKRERTG